MSLVPSAMCWMPSPWYASRYSAIWLLSSALSLIGMRILPQGELRAREKSPVEELTERELEVLSLMAEGHSNEGICKKLFLSPKTVETHVRHILGKLGIGETSDYHRRVLAVLAYLRR